MFSHNLAQSFIYAEGLLWTDIARRIERNIGCTYKEACDHVTVAICKHYYTPEICGAILSLVFDKVSKKNA